MCTACKSQCKQYKMAANYGENYNVVFLIISRGILLAWKTNNQYTMRQSHGRENVFIFFLEIVTTKKISWYKKMVWVHSEVGPHKKHTPHHVKKLKKKGLVLSITQTVLLLLPASCVLYRLSERCAGAEPGAVGGVAPADAGAAAGAGQPGPAARIRSGPEIAIKSVSFPKNKLILLNLLKKWQITIFFLD